jgi:hypothetical protein
MWKFLYASSTGTSHQKIGQPCQDSALARSLVINDETVLVAACADGAGSAKFSEIGSRLACETASRRISERLESGLSVDLIDKDEVLGWHRDVFQVLETEARARSVEARELACTLLLAVIGEKAAFFSQVGDGGIVVLSEDVYQPIFWPQSGEYVNTTNFVTDARWTERFEFSLQRRAVDEVALFTDGLQPLVLRYAEKAAHGPFFVPLFKALRESSPTNELTMALQRFLDSPRVNARTDDDKTLIVATRRLPDVPPQAV